MGPRLTRPSPSEYFDLVSESYADVAIFFSRVCTARAASAFCVFPIILCSFFEIFPRAPVNFPRSSSDTFSFRPL